MAEQVTIHGQPAKIRSPLGVFLLASVTLGIYYLVWYYKTNRELRDVAGIDVQPGVALLAISLGSFLLIPPFVSMWRFYKRIRRAQEAAGVPHPVSHVTGFVLYIVAVFLLPVETAYAQYHSTARGGTSWTKRTGAKQACAARLGQRSSRPPDMSVDMLFAWHFYGRLQGIRGGTGPKV